MKRRVMVVTGSRAEYGILRSVLKGIRAHEKLELVLVVTGMHLSEEYGNTVREIGWDGYKIDARVDMLEQGDTGGAMAKSVGLGVIGLAQAMEQLSPDIVLVLGDRVEVLASAIAASYMNIVVAHIHGGDSSKGGLDEYARHAITKLSHIHFPATEKSAERIKRMGEDEWRVHMVGSPALDDIIFNARLLSRYALSLELGFSVSEPCFLLVQHPVTTQVENASQQIRETLEAIVELGYLTILIYPNSDAGSQKMLEVIKEFSVYSFIKTFKSLPRWEYLNLMRQVSAMVGNSSSGIIEAPSLGLPFVNIGIRQEGRERARNVIDVGHNHEEIITAIKKALTDKEFLSEVEKCQSPYGDGKASERIAEILALVEITPQLLQKKITY